MNEEDKFNSWFKASKYCQVIFPSKAMRQIAYDAWFACADRKSTDDLAHQSAPAAKDGYPMAFPGYPPVPEDRKIPADAGGYGDYAPCPECGSRDCNGQCYGDDMMGDS